MSANQVTQQSVPVPEGMRFKRASTSYFQYLFTVRDKIREANPDLSDGQISKIAASQWNQFSAEQKKPYQELYLKEKSALLKNPQFVPIIKESMENTSNITGNKRKFHEVDQESEPTLSDRIEKLEKIVDSLKNQLDNK